MIRVLAGLRLKAENLSLEMIWSKFLAFSRSLPLHTSLVTNGTLLESRIDEIASYINGVVYVSLDGLEKTHDTIRGFSGCFRKAVGGIMASREGLSDNQHDDNG